jgi:hypothetical protein
MAAHLGRSVTGEVKVICTSDLESTLGIRLEGGAELAFTRSLESGKWQIVLLDTLCGEQRVEVLAHEMGHLWLLENCPKVSVIQYREGFAQYIAAGVLRDKGYTTALNLLESREDLYGQAYHQVCEMIQNWGVAEFLLYLERVD